MDLFEEQLDHTHQPLAYRMRPRTLDEYVGQDHIVGKGRLLRRAIQADQLSSIILYGPPGTGKTTLARVIANTTRSHFSTLNAVLSGVKDLRYEIDEARSRLAHYGKRTILFVDEVHRWNKSQQDALLPWVENGTFILVGATTENPYFEVNSALVSRSRIFQLVPLGPDDLHRIALQALSDRSRGYGKWKVLFESGALEHLVDIANGDARSLLNALELAVETSSDSFPPPEGTSISISKEAAEESIQRKVVLYDKEGDYHFDIISAFIKSIRGSDPDATLYWMARMVSAGEDPKFIFRRMMISACEDVGLADPNAIQIVEADAAAFERIGLPEGRFHLTHAALYLATTAKSNTTMGFFDALKAIEEEKDAEVPNHLKDGSRDKKGFGHGEGYLYPHAYHNHWVPQQYLPGTLQGKVFYHPSNQGYEKRIRGDVLKKREAQLEAVVPDDVMEHLTFGPGDSQRDRWVQRTIGERGTLLDRIREELFSSIRIRRHDRILVLNAGHGLFVWESFRKVPEGLVVAQTDQESHYRHMTHYAGTLDEVERPDIRLGDVGKVLGTLDPSLRFEHLLGRNVFTRLGEAEQLLPIMVERMAKTGTLAFAQTIPSLGSRLSEVASDVTVRRELEKAEQFIYGKEGNPLSSWDENDLADVLGKFGLEPTIALVKGTEQRLLTQEALRRWIERSYAPQWRQGKHDIDVPSLLDNLLRSVGNTTFSWKVVTGIVVCHIGSQLSSG